MRILAFFVSLGVAGCGLDLSGLGPLPEDSTGTGAAGGDGSLPGAGHTPATPTLAMDAGAPAPRPPAADSSVATTANAGAADAASAAEGGAGADAGTGTSDGAAVVAAEAGPAPGGGPAQDAEVADDGGAGALGNGPVTAPATNACDTWGPFEAPEVIDGLDLDGELWAPALSADGKTLYLGMELDSQEHIFSATRPGDGTTFSPAVALDSVNSSSNDGTPFLSFDGLTLYFYSTRPGGIGDRDVWFAQRDTPQSDFAPATLLANVNSTGPDHLPWVSQDNLTLLFSSTRPGGPGSADIFMATRAGPNDDFSPPARLPGMAANSPAGDNRAVMTRDGLTLYFASNRGNPTNDYDLWTATRPDTNSPFADATSLSALNSPGDDIDVFLSWDESELLFSSDRDGTQQIWRSIRHCM